MFNFVCLQTSCHVISFGISKFKVCMHYVGYLLLSVPLGIKKKVFLLMNIFDPDEFSKHKGTSNYPLRNKLAFEFTSY